MGFHFSFSLRIKHNYNAVFIVIILKMEKKNKKWGKNCENEVLVENVLDGLLQYCSRARKLMWLTGTNRHI